MYTLSEKLLAAIMALLLGLSPLQGAVAAVLDTPIQGTGMRLMVEEQGNDTSMPSHQMDHDATQLMPDGGCTTHAGASHHCASCATGIITDLTSLTHPATAQELRLATQDGFTSQPVSSLYRPPRG